ncbi:MAG: thioredoxin family protein [Bacilli bacterium]
MNETKKITITLLVICAIVALLPLSMYIKHTNGKKIIDYVNQTYKNEKSSLIYIGSSDCSYCAQFNPIIDDTSRKYDFEYTYIDILDLTSQQRADLLSSFNIDEEDFGTPYLVISNKGEKVFGKAGYLNADQLIEQLKESEFLDKDAEPKEITDEKANNESTADLNFIDVKEYLELVKNKEKSIVVLSQTTCSYCTAAKPILNKIAKEKEITINVIEINEISDNDEYTAFIETLEGFGMEEFGTPHTMIVQDNKELDNIVGLAEEANYIELFKEQGFIK